MSALGEDLSGGVFRRLYWPVNPAGLIFAVAAAISLLLLHQVLQAGLSYAVMLAAFGGNMSDQRSLVKAVLLVIFPASLIVAAVAWWLAGLRGGRPEEVLSLRRPRLTGMGWLALIGGFVLGMYLVVMAVVLVLGIDLAQYTPGADGQSPSSGSAGLVKEAMFDIANEPLLFLLVFPSIAIGAPLAEEVIFRGQLFSALSNTRLGVSGTTLVTSLGWALLHITEPWLSILLIFFMGLAFGWMMYRFGSLWVPIACHSAWNGIYALIIFTGQGSVS
jgi:membrane protease YdiL (CAAX protease family)